MEALLRSELVHWLRNDPALGDLNGVGEESPLTAPLPWLAIAASASAEWGTKDRRGREVRVALELESRGDAPDAAADLITAIEQRVAAFRQAASGFTVASVGFLRARSEQRGRNRRATLLEFRFRLLENPSE